MWVALKEKGKKKELQRGLDSGHAKQTEWKKWFNWRDKK